MATAPKKNWHGGQKNWHGGVQGGTGGVTQYIYGTDTPNNRQKLYRHAHQLDIPLTHAHTHAWTLNETLKLWLYNNTRQPQPFIDRVDDALSRPLPPIWLVDPGNGPAVCRYNDIGLIWQEFRHRPVVHVVPIAGLIHDMTCALARPPAARRPARARPRGPPRNENCRDFWKFQKSTLSQTVFPIGHSGIGTTRRRTGQLG